MKSINNFTSKIYINLINSESEFSKHNNQLSEIAGVEIDEHDEKYMRQCLENDKKIDKEDITDEELERLLRINIDDEDDEDDE